MLVNSVASPAASQLTSKADKASSNKPAQAESAMEGQQTAGADYHDVASALENNATANTVSEQDVAEQALKELKLSLDILSTKTTISEHSYLADKAGNGTADNVNVANVATYFADFSSTQFGQNSQGEAKIAALSSTLSKRTSLPNTQLTAAQLAQQSLAAKPAVENSQGVSRALGSYISQNSSQSLNQSQAPQLQALLAQSTLQAMANTEQVNPTSQSKSSVEAAIMRTDAGMVDLSFNDRVQTQAGRYEWSAVKLEAQQQNWSKQLVTVLQDRIQMQASQQIKQVNIRLDPPDLGRLEVNIKTDGDRISVTLVANNNGVRDALLDSSGRLGAGLEQQFGGGVDVNVSDDSLEEQLKESDEEVALSNNEESLHQPSVISTPLSWLNTFA